MGQGVKMSRAELFAQPYEDPKFNVGGDNKDAYYNNIYGILFDWLKHVYVSRFTYDNAPDSLNTDLLEALFLSESQYAGVAVGELDGQLRVLGTVSASGMQGAVMPISPNYYAGNFVDLYDYDQRGLGDEIRAMEPLRLERDTLKGDYTVVFNKTGYLYSISTQSDLNTIAFYAAAMANILTLAYMNRENFKTSVVVKAENGQLDAREFVTQWQAGMSLIQVEPNTSVSDQVELMNLNVPDFQKSLMDQQNNLLSMFLTQVGINNSVVDKRERLIKDEANANNQLINLSGGIYLKPRERALRLLNKRYGTNIKVSFDFAGTLENPYSDMPEQTNPTNQTEEDTEQ